MLPILAPVVEVPGSHRQLWPWEISDRHPYSFIRLGDGMAAGDIGLVFAQLVNYNHIEGRDVEAIQTGIIEADHLVLPGGLRASCRDQQIGPSCCCGLEDWREWEKVLTGGSPWLGHDPDPWVELSGSVVRIWSDGGLIKTRDAFSIVFEQEHFVAELERAGRELRSFLTQSAAWAQSAGFSDVDLLCSKLDSCFAIMQPRRDT